MNKADVLAKFEEYKGRIIQIGMSDEGHLLFGGITGHWLFVKDDCVVEVKKNTSNIGHYGYDDVTQNVNPFVITTVNFDDILYIRSYFGSKPGEIAEILNGLTPVGTDDDLSDIISQVESDSIRKAASPSGNLNDTHVAPGGAYGSFKGSMISTEIGGLPGYVKNALLSQEDSN